METDNPRDIFPTGKNPDYGGSKKRYPPHGKILTENSQAVNRATPLVRPSVVGWPGSGTGSTALAISTGKKTRPQAVNQAQHRLEAMPADWGNPRRFLRPAKWAVFCSRGPGRTFSTDSQGFCPLDAALAGCECAAAATAEGWARAAGEGFPKHCMAGIVLECYRHRSMSTLASSSASNAPCFRLVFPRRNP